MTQESIKLYHLINTHLDCILIWSNNDHVDKKSKIAEQVELIRKIIE